MSPPQTNIFFNSSIILLFLFLFFHTCYSIDPQGQSLLTWKQTLLNSSSSAAGLVLTSWNPSHPNPCTWYGIRCNSNHNVIELTLRDVNLQGQLPSNLHSLPYLQSIILSSTNLTGTIPKQFAEFKHLTLLDLSDNSLSGQIPFEICHLPNLQTLALNTNLLQGRIPSQIGNLSSLITLTLYDNQLSGEIPNTIGSLTSLQIFRAGGNKNLQGQVPYEIGNCSDLVILGLAETSISGQLPPSIGMLKKLQTLAIYTSLLSGPIPDEIGDCTQLQNLFLYQNSISGSIPLRIGELGKLQSLLLWQNSLVGSIPEELGKCTELTVIDLSENLLTGAIPRSLGKLPNLKELQLSVNQLSGTIPIEICDCKGLTHLEFDNNKISGEIPAGIGNLESLTLFFAWQNNLTGTVPESISECLNLQALDLSYNSLFGSIPTRIFQLQNLTKILLISNEFSGFIPPDIGNCSSLYRVRLNGNRLGGAIPSEIGNLKELNFLDLSNNRLIGEIPPAISRCQSLEFLDLHSNGFAGSLPETLPPSLQLIDASDNRITGVLPRGIGLLTELTKLHLGKNQISGIIPPEISSCSKLQLLNLGDNRLSGEIPKEIGQIPALEISLNLSCNQFSGEIPSQFSGLNKLAVLDISHNALKGKLDALAAGFQNLVSLNISFNEFSGELPDTPFFRKLPVDDFASNKGLYVAENGAFSPADHGRGRSAMKLLTSVLLSASAVLILLAIFALVRGRVNYAVDESMMMKMEDSGHWEMTLYQKMELSIDEIVKNLISANVIGNGSSGVVYRVITPKGETLAVKKMWSGDESGAFNSEIRTLGSIRHRNIVRLLGWGSNRNVKLLFYDYLPNGSLSSFLHGAAGASVAKFVGIEWEMRYDVVVGVAHALAYLHHDCVPAILHGDVKAMNVLLGRDYEAYLADFGLARVMNDGEDNGDDDGGLSKSKPRPRPLLAGSYGYMAPEHALMQKITIKSDVYSFGVVILEVLTGRHPLDPTLPGGAHLVEWVREHLVSKKNPSDILDPKLRGRSDPTMHEMLQTLAVSFLCISPRPADRPSMNDVVAMLKEIRHDEATTRSSEEKGYVPTSTTATRTPSRNIIVSQTSSQCSFAFSDESV
ncbi:Leucine-rich repeat receptor-like serine/threonine-protein kinase RGI4 [Linum perenne]